MSTAVLSSAELYSDYVNPEWVKLLDLLDMNASYTRCDGVELHTADGRRLLDFLSGYCVHNTGHNHPHIISALKDELDQHGPAMLQSHVSGLAGELASRLCALAGGRVQKVFFCSSGSEGVEAAIKFARAHTRRNGILYNDGAFHGLTCGALSLMGSPFWREGFGPLLPDTEAIPFNDLEALEAKLKSRKFAAFILEPDSVRSRHSHSRPALPGRSCRIFAANTARSSFSMKCRPACIARESFSPHTTTTSSPTW